MCTARDAHSAHPPATVVTGAGTHVSRSRCGAIRVSFALQMVHSASLHSFKLVFLVSARN